MPMAVPGWFGFERAWLSRGLKAIHTDRELLDKKRIEEAQFRLALGNQQVFALGHWLKALGLVTKANDGYVLTSRGLTILQNDSQIEENGTWFAIHYWLATSKEYAFCYWCAMNCLPRQFDRAMLMRELEKQFPGKSQSTYFNHTRTFLAVIRGTAIGNELGILVIRDESISSDGFDSRSIHPAIVAYAICDWSERTKRSTAGTGEMLELGGPARSLILDSWALDEFLDKIQDRYLKRVLWVSRTAGLNSVTFANDFPPLALLNAYYLEHVTGVEPIEALLKGIERQKTILSEVTR